MSSWWDNKTPGERAEIVRKNSESNKKFWESRTLEEVSAFRAKVSESKVDWWNSLSDEEQLGYSIKRSEMMRMVWADRTPEERAAILDRLFEGRKEWWIRLSLKEKEEWSKTSSSNNSRWWTSASEEDKNERVGTFYRGNGSPNQPEISLDLYLQNRFPEEWLYNGTGDTLIGGKRPDFININGKKEVIEVFGTFWHPDEDEPIKIEHYKKYGFRCRVVWEYDCYDWKGLDKVFGVER